MHLKSEKSIQNGNDRVSQLVISNLKNSVFLNYLSLTLNHTNGNSVNQLIYELTNSIIAPIKQNIYLSDFHIFCLVVEIQRLC